MEHAGREALRVSRETIHCLIMPCMCGIAGIVRFDDQPIDEDRLHAMLEHVRHRGPDGQGLRIMNRCALAHARLSIIDPTDGEQPMREGMSGEGQGGRARFSVREQDGGARFSVREQDGGARFRVRERSAENAARQSGPGGLHVIFNGEIYNHRELRCELENLGHRFHTDHSDTEVLLPGFRQWGTQLPKHLEGMFAFALWEEGEQRLFLACDRIGQKPLYLRRGQRELAFASLAAALAAIPAPSSRTPQERRDDTSCLTFLRYGYSFEQSMIQGIEELPPGHWMMIERDGTMRREHYWRPRETTSVHGDTSGWLGLRTCMKRVPHLVPSPRGQGVHSRYNRLAQLDLADSTQAVAPKPVLTHVLSLRAPAQPPRARRLSPSQPTDLVEHVLGDAVACRLEADVPLGCFLSGGIDSSLIAAIAQQALRAGGADRLKTFSVAMPDLAYDESEHARVVAEHIGTDHAVLRIGSQSADDVIADLAHLIHVTGEPTADSSILPTYWLCRAARQHVKTALSGDGGDELFGGYDRYRALRWLQRSWLRRAAAMMPGALFQGSNSRSMRVRLGRLIDSAKAGPDPARQYHRMIHLFSEAQIRELGIPGVSERVAEDTSPFVEDSSGGAWATNETGAVSAAMQWDLAHYLPYEVLRKVDRASMAVALEVRSPMLDSRVCELATSLPPSVLMPNGRPKGLLRDVAARYLPASIIHRPKRGFALPIGGWFRTWMKDALADHLFDGTLADMGLTTATIRPYFDDHAADRADHTHRLFALLELALWGKWLKTDATSRGAS